MFVLNLCLAALFVPIMVHVGMKRFAPRYAGAVTGLVIGLGLLYLIEACMFFLMISRVVLMGGSIHRIFDIYFYPAKLLCMVMGSSDNYRLQTERWSLPSLIVSAVFWGCLGCLIGHLIARRSKRIHRRDVLISDQVTSTVE